MSQLLEVRKNILYTKEKGEFNRVHEIVLIVDKPIYKRTNEGNVIRERGCEELKFTIPNDSMFDKFIEILKGIKEVEEEDLN